MVSRKIRNLLWTIAALLLALFAIRTFVGWPYFVNGTSMEPTLFDGDCVFVLWDGSPPGRHEPVVLRRAGEVFVKRAAGLPGESVRVDDGGDLWIDGRRAPVAAPRPRPIPVFDAARQDVQDHFRLGGSSASPWRRDGAEWELDAREIKRDSSLGLMGLHKGLHADWIDPDGEMHYGVETIDVGDAIVEFSFEALEPGGRLRVLLDERGDMFQLALELQDGGEAHVELAHIVGGDVLGREILRSAVVPFEVGAWTRIWFANVDNQVRAELGEPPAVLAASYDENTFWPRDVNEIGMSPGQRVRLGGEECRVRVRDIRAWRDLHYTRDGDFATDTALHLGAGEYFVLGDNSKESQDSRTFGAVPARDLIGRPLWVVWPPSAIRRVPGLAPLFPARGAAGEPE